MVAVLAVDSVGRLHRDVTIDDAHEWRWGRLDHGAVERNKTAEGLV